MRSQAFSLGLSAALLALTFQQASAGWTYPSISLAEGPPLTGAFADKFAIIKSDDTRVVSYALTGVGVDQPDAYDNTVKFSIDSSTGALRQLVALDRENKARYTPVASALDADGEKVEKDVELVIVVTDINDNKPIFANETLIGSVEEASDEFTPSFMTVKATDADTGYYSSVRYSMVDNSDSPPSSGPRFNINSNTGQINVVGTLDHEEYPKVTFKVIAVDGGGVVAGATVTAVVTVNVLDSNDHPPVIDPTPAKPVSELFPTGTALYDITASDMDEGVNGRVYFMITNGNTGDTFGIDSEPSDTGKSKGILKLNKELDFESGVQSYSLTIRAYNKEADNAASDEYASTTIVSITVTDENEPPIFENTPYIRSVTEEEDAENDSPALISVFARDHDFGFNQTVSYSIADDPENWFTMNSETGDIRRIGKINREVPSVKGGVYALVVTATDNYNHGAPASENAKVSFSINDINDNPPMPIPHPGSGDDYNISICIQPSNVTVINIKSYDPDSPANGAPFTYRFDSTVDSQVWAFEKISDSIQRVVTFTSDFDEPQKIELPYTIVDSGSPPQTGTSTLTVSICECDDNNVPACGGNVPLAGGFPIAIIIAIIVVLLLIIILVFALIAYKRRKEAMILKEPFFDDEDDVRENLQVYQEEGGEEDQDAYDLSALQVPLLDDPNGPIRIEKPIQQPAQPRVPRGIPDDIGDYIGDAKDQADNDPSAPPFDSLLVFDYEGQGSDAGSLSSINTATTDGSMDYDHLNNWGPRFKRLADMYNDGSDSD